MTQGFYIIPQNPDLPRDLTHKHLKVGPYRVLVRNKQHYRLYTCEVQGVEILKQASLPSVDELYSSLCRAVEKKLIRTSDVSQLMKESNAALEFRSPHKKTRTVHEDAPMKHHLKRKGGAK